MTGHNMSESNKALTRRWFEEVWNQGRLDAAANGGQIAGDGLFHVDSIPGTRLPQCKFWGAPPGGIVAPKGVTCPLVITAC